MNQKRESFIKIKSFQVPSRALKSILRAIKIILKAIKSQID